MAKKKESQVTLMDHSFGKVKLLRTYLEKYIPILTVSGKFKRIIYYDLFSGPGIYDGGGKGSPVNVLEVIKGIVENPQIINNKIQYLCRFNDGDKNIINKLQSNISELELDSMSNVQIKYSNLPFNEVSNEICEKIADLYKPSDRGFIFLDPYGYKDISFNTIQKLLKNKNTEVLLWLPTHSMYRFDKKGTPKSLQLLIQELMPIEKWPTNWTGLEFIDSLKTGMKNKLGKDYYVDTFVLEREKNEFYCLFFFTSNVFGFEKMLESKWNLDQDEGRGWKLQKASLFEDEIKDAKISSLEEKVLSFIKTPRNNVEIKTFSLHLGLIPKHINEILDKHKHQIRVESLGDKIKSGYFYIGESKEKVKIQWHSQQ